MPVFSNNKWNDSLDIVNNWKKDKLKIGFTNGCFDIIHPGHVKILSEAKKLCDKLVVGINSDYSIKQLKGNNRPINKTTDRACIIEAISFTDLVIIFNENTPLNLINYIQPNILIKGSDYKISEVIGSKEVRKLGGSTHLINLKDNYSTTNLIKKIVKTYQ